MQMKADSTTSSTTSSQTDLSTGTRSVDGAYVAPLEKNSSMQSATAHPKTQAKADGTAKSTTSAKADVNCGTKSVDGAYVAPLEKNSSQQQAAADGKGDTTLAADCATHAKPKVAKKKSTKTAYSK
jgi:hypothetical protein